MPDKKKIGLLAAILLFLITICAAIFVVKIYLFSPGSDDSASTAPAEAQPGQGQIQVGILLSDFSATGPHRQSAPYGYQTQLRALRTLRDPLIHLVPVIEPNTAGKGALPRILHQNFLGEVPLDASKLEDLQKIDVLVSTAAANVHEDVTEAIWQRVRQGMGLLQRQLGYLTPGYVARTNELAGFDDAVFGWNANAVDCQVVASHPLLGDLSGQIGKIISLTPNGAVGRLKGIPLLRVKNMRQVMLVAADHTVGTGEYLYPLYVSQLGQGRIVGIGYTQGKDVPPELEAANHDRFYIHCVEWLAGKPLN
ncbi:MAG: hypothetical protein ABSC42_03305 [Tepidisphaeraceae bacterium]|jgi:hypothetical protein